MNRTKKLMTAVTTSLMLTGTLPIPGAVVPAFGQTAPQADESWKTDPQVRKAADGISEWLKGTTAQHPKTQEDVQEQFPGLDVSLVQKALKLLVYTGDIKKMGDGSKDNPLRYFEFRGRAR